MRRKKVVKRGDWIKWDERLTIMDDKCDEIRGVMRIWGQIEGWCEQRRM